MSNQNVRKNDIGNRETFGVRPRSYNKSGKGSNAGSTKAFKREQMGSPQGHLDIEDVELQGSINPRSSKGKVVSTSSKRQEEILQKRSNTGQQSMRNDAQSYTKSVRTAANSPTKQLETRPIAESNRLRVEDATQQRVKRQEMSGTFDAREENRDQVDDMRSQGSRQSVASRLNKRGSFIGKSGSMDAEQLKIENDRLQTTIMILNQKLKSQTDSDLVISNLRKKNRECENEHAEFNKSNLSLQHEVQSLKSENSFLKSQISTMESTIDSQNQSSQDKDMEIDRGETARAELKLDLEELNHNLTIHEEDLYSTKIELNEKSKQLQYAQGKIQELSDKCEELYKNQAVYIGHKGDQIDMQLASFINKYPERDAMQILFIRETEGVYKFGQKRVYIKVEKGNQIKVRVGGGYMHIEDFIDQYSEQEGAKIERRNVMSRFQNKLSLQKISSEQAHVAYEQSPIRSPQRGARQRSPQSSKILQRSPQSSPGRKRKRTIQQQQQ